MLYQTYNIDAQTGESSACATALLCGVKARYETLGLDAGGRFNNCASTINSKVTSLVDWAHDAGMIIYFVVQDLDNKLITFHLNYQTKGIRIRVFA